LTNKDFTEVDQDKLEDDISGKAQQAWQNKKSTTMQLTEGQYNRQETSLF